MNQHIITPYSLHLIVAFSKDNVKKAIILKGYYTSNGYMGYVLGKGYQLFESEDAYYEYCEEVSA